MKFTMINKLKNEKIYLNVRLWYIVCVLIYSLARQFIVALQPVLMHNAFNIAAVGFAGLLFLWDIVAFRNSLKSKYIWLLIALFVATGISTLINFSHSFTDNVKAMANMFIQFFVLYAVGKGLTRERLDGEIKVIGSAVGALWMVAAFISVLMYFLDIGYTQTNYIWGDPKPIVQGFVHMDDGAKVMRLWGVFVDPNFAAAVSIIVICVCAYLLYLSTKKWVKALHIVNIVIQGLYIVLSGSRMALLILLLLSAVGGWYFGWNIFSRLKKTAGLKTVFKELLAVALAIVTTVSCYAVHTAARVSLPYIRQGLVTLENTVFGTPDAGDDGNGDGQSNELLDLNRDDIESKTDISNGRLALWGEGFRVFKENAVFGVGPRGYSAVAKELDADMHISRRSVHNSYMELLMGNGVVGFLLMLAFFVLCAYKGIKLRRRESGVNVRVGILLLIVLSALAGGMFISSLFYYLSGISIIAFALLGYAMAFISREENV